MSKILVFTIQVILLILKVPPATTVIHTQLTMNTYHVLPSQRPVRSSTTATLTLSACFLRTPTTTNVFATMATKAMDTLAIRPDSLVLWPTFATSTHLAYTATLTGLTFASAIQDTKEMATSVKYPVGKIVSAENYLVAVDNHRKKVLLSQCDAWHALR